MQIHSLENSIKLINMLLTEEEFRVDLANTLFDREDSKTKLHALRVLAKTLIEIIDFGTLFLQ